jgi:membrane associated rhomboid family serine protease
VEFLRLFDFLIFIVVMLFLSSILVPTPFSDTGTVRYRTIPWMTFALIIVNSFVFIIFQAFDLYQGGASCYPEIDWSTCDQFQRYIDTVYSFGFRGSYLREGISVGAFTTFSAMFMHGDFWHLLGNMIYLWTFGRRVEDASGSGRFLVYYLLSGMVAHIGTAILNPGMDLPGIGASGAIAGVMGAYLVLFPGARVTSFWGVGSVFRVPVILIQRLLGQVSNTARWVIGGLLGAGIGYLVGGGFVALLGLEVFGGDALEWMIDNVGLIQLIGVVVSALTFGFLLGQTPDKDAPIWRWTVRIPAGLFLIFFLVRELVPTVGTIQGTQEFTGVNNIAHVTGFLAAVAIFFFVRKDLLTRYFSGRTV